MSQLLGVLQTVGYLALAVVLLMVMITIHEFGHYITAKILKKGVRYKELPISYNARSNEEGKKIGWKDGVQAVYTLIKYRFF